MVKCFLSHSSKDKEFYVRKVAENLRKEVKIFDEETFESGMSPFEEIIKGLDETSLFVIFISDNALNSEWVKRELVNAKVLLDDEKIERIYPIIIDPKITYEDVRIPAWMKDGLNIQHIVSPKISARKITSRLIEISWKYHPKLRERQKLFVGRNDLTKQTEERLDDFSLITPSVIIASGLNSIGRRSFIRYALTKANLIRESFEFPVVTLSPQDSIEDFILKINDLGVVESEDLSILSTGAIKDKVQVAKRMANNIVLAKERVLIEDNGVIVQGDGQIVDWFGEIISDIASRGFLTFCIVSKFRPKMSINRTNPAFFVTHVYELDKTERNGLLVRYTKHKEMQLTQDEYSFFSDLLTGYPEQVFYAVDLIEEAGVYNAKKKSYNIQQYSSDRAKVVLNSFKDHQKLLNLIYLLSKFEFISYETLFSIVDEASYTSELEVLFNSAVCEKLGSSGAYIRVNEVIRDYVSRSRFNLLSAFDSAIKKHVTDFVKNYKDDKTDLSDYLFSAQEAVLRGLALADEVILPSILIKSIKKLYDEDRNYPDAIALCDRVLAKEKFLHSNTVNYVRYIKCQCLARQGDKLFFAEVKPVPEPDRSFLYGFYYRISGELSKAEENLKKVLSLRPRDPRAIGELVLIYMQTEEYDLAFDLAKDNYVYHAGNPINANNYFMCLIQREKNESNRNELEEVIRRLSLDTSDKAQEMVYSAKARMLAYYDQNFDAAFLLVEEALQRFEDVVYPGLLKAELATNSENKAKLSEAVSSLGKFSKRKAQTYRTFLKYKAFLMAMEGNLRDALKLVREELSGYSDASKRKIIGRIEYFAEEIGHTGKAPNKNKG